MPLSNERRDVLSKELHGIMRSDFPTFCALALRIKPKGGGRTQPFLWFNGQRIIWKRMVARMKEGKPPYIVCLKFRQGGISTFFCAWIFYQAWRQTDITCTFISHQKTTNETMISTMRVFYDEMPADIKPKLRPGSRQESLPRGELYFGTDSTGKPQRSEVLLHLSDNLDPRGQQSTHVVETEFAMYKNAFELNGALLPQLPPRGSAAYAQSSFAIESTPKGLNAFYYYFQLGLDPKSEWVSVFLAWMVQEEEYSLALDADFGELTAEEAQLKILLSIARREIDGHDVTDEQMYYRRCFIRDKFLGDVTRWDQEFPSDPEACFLLMSESLFKNDMDYLNACIREARVRAIDHWRIEGHEVTTAPNVAIGWDSETRKSSYEIDPQSAWTVWEKPLPGHRYVIGGDVCEGLGGKDNDNSTGFVLDVDTGRQVAEFARNLKPEPYADELNAAGRWYNNALLVPEINKLGYVVLNRLLKHHAYPNMYRWPKFDEANGFTSKRGWETNSRTKLLMMSALCGHIEERTIEIASYALLTEASTFEKEGDQYGAQAGKHDDRLIAMALALMGVEQTPKLAAVYKSKSKFPSTGALGISAAPAHEEKPMPAAIQEIIDKQVTFKVPWDPMGTSEIF